MSQGTRVVVIGGGVVGLEVASRLLRSELDAEITVVDPDGIHVYQPLLPEVAAGVIEPRHAVVPLRAALPAATILNGEAVDLDRGARTVRVRRRDHVEVDLAYDHLVLAPGSVTRVLPVPGLAERAVGFQTVAEALHLRDRVLDRMHLAEASTDHDRRAQALTFVFVGAGYSGVEALGELQHMAEAACAQFDGIDPGELRFVLVEATDRILPMVVPELRRAAIAELERRGVEVRLETLVEAVDDRSIRLSDGTEVVADTLVWCAGARPHDLGGLMGLPVDDDGAIEVEDTLAVVGSEGLWSAGDCAAVPDLVRGGTCPGSAQYAVRQARQLAANIIAVEQGGRPKAFRYRQKGELITLGRGHAVGYVGPVAMTGRVPWALRTAFHLTRFPTLARKVRVGVDWFVNLLFPRDITSLGSARDPEEPMQEAVEVFEREAS